MKVLGLFIVLIGAAFGEAPYDNHIVTVTSTTSQRALRVTRATEVTLTGALYFTFACNEEDTSCPALGVGSTYKILRNANGPAYKCDNYIMWSKSLSADVCLRDVREGK